MDLAIVIGVIVGMWFVYEQGVKHFHLRQFTKLIPQRRASRSERSDVAVDALVGHPITQEKRYEQGRD